MSALPADIIAAAEATGRYGSFLRALEAAGMLETLRAPGPFTVFAPNDDAFEKLPSSTRAGLLSGADKSEAETVLGYHIAQGSVSAQRFAGKRIRAVTMSGGTLLIDGAAAPFTINGARCTEPDLRASNGVLHGIDSVLWPREPGVSARA